MAAAVPTLGSKSVRVAIEQDALQQALLLQNELQELVSMVETFSQGVEETAAIALRVREATQMQVTTMETPNTTRMPARSSLPNETAAANVE